MINMDYCKFENTAYAVRECLDSMLGEDFTTNNLSDSEKERYERLRQLCLQYLSIAAEIEVKETRAKNSVK